MNANPRSRSNEEKEHITSSMCDIRNSGNRQLEFVRFCGFFYILGVIVTASWSTSDIDKQKPQPPKSAFYWSCGNSALAYLVCRYYRRKIRENCCDCEKGLLAGLTDKDRQEVVNAADRIAHLD